MDYRTLSHGVNLHLFPSCIMETSPVKQASSKSDKCRWAELVQYVCEPELIGGRPTFRCSPIIRVFRL